jgi:hypothetical protein
MELTVEERLRRLERRHRGLKVWFWITVPVLAAGLLVAWLGVFVVAGFLSAARHPKSLAVQNLAIVDGDGHTRLQLWVSETGPVANFFDSQDRRRIAIGFAKDGPALVLYNEATKPIAALLQMDKGGPLLKLSTKDGGPATQIGVWDDLPEVQLFDKAMHPRATMYLGRSGAGFQLVDDQRRLLWSAVPFQAYREPSDRGDDGGPP